MVDIYFFKNIVEIGNDFYFRIDHTGKLEFITVEDEYIFTALDLATVLRKGESVNGVRYKSINIEEFSLLSPGIRRVVNRSRNLKYWNDGSVILVRFDVDFNYDKDKLKIEYWYTDSDRHKEKDEIEFDIDTEAGIISTSSDHFFYVRKDIFKNFEITKL